MNFFPTSFYELLLLLCTLIVLISAAFVINWLFHDEITGAKEIVIKLLSEFRAVVNRERSMRSLNGLLIIVLAIGLIVFGLFFGPQPTTALFAFGKGITWVLILAVTALICFRLAGAEKR